MITASDIAWWLFLSAVAAFTVMCLGTAVSWLLRFLWIVPSELLRAVRGQAGGEVRSEESEEFTKWRRDQEDAEGFKANPSPWKRRYVPPAQIREIDPRDRD